VGSTSPWKGKGKDVEMASSDEESAYLSSQDGPCIAAVVRDEDSPTSSDESNDEAPGAANGR
jgi:hypothetical protein